MSVTQLSQLTLAVEPNYIGNSPTKKPKMNCSTCYYESSNYECKHPKNGTKRFERMEMYECYKRKAGACA